MFILQYELDPNCNIQWNGIQKHAFLKAYLLAKDPEKNTLEDERRPFSIGGLTYDELKDKCRF